MVEVPKEVKPPQKDNIDQDFVPKMFTVWEQIEQKYVEGMKQVFNEYWN